MFATPHLERDSSDDTDDRVRAPAPPNGDALLTAKSRRRVLQRQEDEIFRLSAQERQIEEQTRLKEDEVRVKEEEVRAKEVRRKEELVQAAAHAAHLRAEEGAP